MGGQFKINEINHKTVSMWTLSSSFWGENKASAGRFVSAALTVMKCLMGNCQQLGETRDLETPWRHSTHTHIHTLAICTYTYSLYTYKHTHLVTPGQLSPTANYCSAHMVMALKPLDHVWIDLWCGCWSTNRHEAEFLKTAEPGRHDGSAEQTAAKCFMYWTLFYSLHLNNSILKAPKTCNTRLIITFILR